MLKITGEFEVNNERRIFTFLMRVGGAFLLYVLSWVRFCGAFPLHVLSCVKFCGAFPLHVLSCVRLCGALTLHALSRVRFCSCLNSFLDLTKERKLKTKSQKNRNKHLKERKPSD